MKTDEALLTPLSKTRLHEEIVAQLKDRIIRGDFPPESKLPPERDLAERLNVNRTTVREALHKLESLGLVSIRHGQGIFVRDYRESTSLDLVKEILFLDGRLNTAVLKNLLDLRRLLMPEMSHAAALNRSRQDLRDLETVIVKNTDMELAERDGRVHHIIARASGNLLFVILLNSFTDLAGRFTNLYFHSPENRRRSEAFHREIFEAIRDRRAEDARHIMRDVLVYAEKKTLRAMETAGQTGESET